MKTHIDIDGDALEAVQQLGGFATQRETGNASLVEMTRKLAARELLGMRGMLKWEGDLGEQRGLRFVDWEQGR